MGRDRHRLRLVAPGMLHELAEATAAELGVCTRPIAVRRTDTVTGESTNVGIRCGSTKANVCPSCAENNRRVRMDQAREGWHLTDEPQMPPVTRTAPVQRRVRSTRRRQDAPDLPSHQIASVTVGRTFEAPDGKSYRPSTFLTLTLPSYGPVRGDGSPVDPECYDYRRAARDALHFGELIDRFWQNLRRACGWDVQYFAAVEPQKRGAPHLHAAVRGTMPRKLIRQVVAATYHQVWWPPCDQLLYSLDQLPEWDREASGWVDRDTRQLLPTWDQALDAIDTDPEAAPAHVIRFGTRGVDVQGVVAGTEQAGGALRYLVKYLTKAVADCHTTTPTTAAALHVERLAAELRWQPCSSRCANWLLYGVQPEHAHAELLPGACPSAAHRSVNLGYAGRRCLVSRKWTGKTLTEHRADRRAHVMRALGAVGIRVDQDTPDNVEPGRYRWEAINPNDPHAPDRTELLIRAINQRRRWRAEYQQARSATDDQVA